jgi:hypothetical protein
MLPEINSLPFWVDSIVIINLIGYKLEDPFFLSACVSMAQPATQEERYDLITRRLQEVLGSDTVKAILAEGKVPKGYWGTYIQPRVFCTLI